MNWSMNGGGAARRGVILTAVVVTGVLGYAPGGITAAGAARQAGTCAATSPTPSDFNGDGSPDVAIGAPNAEVAGQAQAGVVHIRYGSGGQPGTGDDVSLTQTDAGETAESGDHFGAVLAVGRIDDDTCADLVVGVPDEDVGSVTDAGIVQVIYGSPDGLGKGTPSRVIRVGADGAPGVAAAGDHFGAAVATGYTNHRLVIGAPGVDVGGAADAGQVTYVPFVSGRPGPILPITQNTDGVPGTAEAGDHFGASVACGVLQGEPDGIVVGAPGEDIGDVADAGSVTAVVDPLRVVGGTVTSVAISQDTAGVSGAPEAGDRFGASLAGAQPLSNPFLFAVGVPGEDVGDAADAGMVQVFSGSDFAEALAVDQSTAGVAGAAEAGDRFGEQVAMGRTQTSARLLVGIPGEDRDAIADSGAVQELMVSDVTDNVLLDQESLGATSDAGEHFGASVSYAGVLVKPAWIIGVPDDQQRFTGVVYSDTTRVGLGGGDVPPPTSTVQTWTPQSGGRFGASTASGVS